MALIKTVYEESKSDSNLQEVLEERKLDSKPFYWDGEFYWGGKFYWGGEFEPLLENMYII